MSVVFRGGSIEVSRDGGFNWQVPQCISNCGVGSTVVWQPQAIEFKFDGDTSSSNGYLVCNDGATCGFAIPPPNVCTDVVTSDGGGAGTTYRQNESISLFGSSTTAVYFSATVAPSMIGFFSANGTVAYEIVLGGRDITTGAFNTNVEIRSGEGAPDEATASVSSVVSSGECPASHPYAYRPNGWDGSPSFDYCCDTEDAPRASRTDSCSGAYEVCASPPCADYAAADDNRFWADVTDGMVRVGRGYSASRRTLITWQVIGLGLLGPGFQSQRTDAPGAGRTLLRPSFDPGAAHVDSYLTAQMATAMVMLSPVSTGHMI